MINCVAIVQKYWISLKNTKSADKISPIPKLNSTSKTTGITNKKNFAVKAISSKATKPKKIINVNKKLIKEEVCWDKRNINLGTFIFEITSELLYKDIIPMFVASLKYANINCPANK